MSTNPCDIEISGGHLSDISRTGLAVSIISTGVVSSVLATALFVTSIDAGHVSDSLSGTRAARVIEVGHVGSFATSVLHSTSLALEKGKARDRTYQSMLDTSIDHCTVADMLLDRTSSLVSERGHVANLIVQTARGSRTTIEKGKIFDLLGRRYDDRVAELGHVGDLLRQSARRHDSLLEHGQLSDLLHSASATMDNVAEHGCLSDLVCGQAETAQLVLDAGLLEAWVIDSQGSILWTAECETLAMSRIQAHGLEGIALLNGQLAGCSPDGLHSFNGPSAPKIVTDITDFGSNFEKRAGYVYVGYNGQPLSVSVTAGAEGEAVSYTYSLPPRTANFSSPGKVKLGRGLRSRYWQFSLSGTQFALNDVELIMDTTSRKI